MSLKPTYEELKLQVGTRLWHRMDGLKPTYEELKPIGNRAKGEGHGRLKPTYEELKLIVATNRRRNTCV